VNRNHQIKLLRLALIIAVPLLLRDPISYLIWPDDSLNREAGWLSYREDRSSRISVLLWLGADPNKLNESRGYAPIHSAAHWGNAKAVRQLIANGANPNLKSRSGDTPLDLACAFGHQEAVPILVAMGGKTSLGETKCKENR
jgi:ankyrin repeat protein